MVDSCGFRIGSTVVDFGRERREEKGL